MNEEDVSRWQTAQEDDKSEFYYAQPSKIRSPKAKLIQEEDPALWEDAIFYKEEPNRITQSSR